MHEAVPARMEEQNIIIRDPSAWRDEISKLFSRDASLENITLTVTIQVYGPLRDEEEWTRVDRNPWDEELADYDENYHIRILNPLTQEWVSAIRSTFEASGLSHGERDKHSKITFNFDIAPPTDIDRFARGRLAHSEPRILTRLSSLLRSTFRPHTASLEGTISGSPCWCQLQERESCIAILPRGRSYPIKRESHVQARLDELRAHWLDESMQNYAGYELEERKRIGSPGIEQLRGHVDKEGLRCLRLAKEHWDDAYCEGGENEEEDELRK